MAHFSLNDAKAWCEPSKTGESFDSIDENLAAQVASTVLPRLTNQDTSGWTSEANTPALVRTIICMHYVAMIYDRTYSTDQERSPYATLLRRLADDNLDSIVNGIVDLPEVPNTEEVGLRQPSFFPNDASSLMQPSLTSPSDGGPAFTMGEIW